jgi:hypothetical protein
MSQLATLPKPVPVAEPARIPHLVTLKELAAMWSLPISWLQEQTRSRTADKLPHYKCGKYTRVDLNDGALQEWISRRRLAVKR